MDNSSSRPGRLDEDSFNRMLAAFEQFFDTGTCSVLCDVCHSPITFEALSETAWRHSCECGKYNGTAKGL